MISGKTIFNWNLPAIDDKSPSTLPTILTNAGFEGVCLKAGNGYDVQRVSRYSPWPNWGENVKEEYVDALKEAGLKVYFWHFLHGYYPQGELNVALAQCDRFKPDGYIWDVEGSFDSKTNAVDNARLVSKGLRRLIPHMPQGLCWWALPKSPTTGVEWHPVKVAKAFLESVDVGMPMMYWQGTGSAAATNYLHTSLRLWREFTDAPIVPIGRTYNGDGGYADPAGISAFAYEVYRIAPTQNLIGNSWYSIDEAVKYPSWLMTLMDTPKFGSGPLLTIEEKVKRLVGAHPELFPELG